MKHPETDKLTDQLHKQEAPLVVRYQEMTMKAQKLECERDAMRSVAGELCAAIRINTMRGTFATATTDDIEPWLKQWTDKLGPNPAICPTNAIGEARSDNATPNQNQTF
jgi:hypothetical protein